MENEKYQQIEVLCGLKMNAQAAWDAYLIKTDFKLFDTSNCMIFIYPYACPSHKGALVHRTFCTHLASGLNLAYAELQLTLQQVSLK